MTIEWNYTIPIRVLVIKSDTGFQYYNDDNVKETNYYVVDPNKSKANTISVTFTHGMPEERRRRERRREGGREEGRRRERGG
jgi:hypothetical protein